MVQKKVKVDTSSEPLPKFRTALTPESRENQMVSLAMDLAEKQLRDGTASSQVISHYIKIGSMKERAELERLKLEKDLIIAKTKALESSERIEELYTKAMDAMRVYSGRGETQDDDYS